jgi:cytosine deaminase
MHSFRLHNASLPGRPGSYDFTVADGHWETIEPTPAVVPSDSLPTYDLGGRLLSAPFVDAHFHLDSVLTRLPNQSGTLREGIENWGTYKREQLSAEDVYRRATAYCERALAHGIQAIRSHVDVSDPRLLGVEALLQVREEWRDRITVQLVAFPQDGFYATPEAEGLLLRALDRGLDVVGGIPHHERTTELGRQSLLRLFDIAEERGLPLDFHCDESDDPHSRHVETVAEETRRRGLGGRVVVSHVTSSAMMDPYYLHRKLLPLVADAGLHLVVNPRINVHLGGHFHHPAPRAMAPIKDFLAAGVNVACAQDCNEDPWYPLGDADLLDVARVGAHLGHMMGREELTTLFASVTTRAAWAIGLDREPLRPGQPAHAILLAASDPLEALRTAAHPLAVLRHGEWVVPPPAAACPSGPTA